MSETDIFYPAPESSPRQQANGATHQNGSTEPSEPPKVPQLPREIPACRDANKYSQRGKTIIICLDGTGDQFDADNSNIVHLVTCLKKSSPKQVTYYQSGIGTYDGGGVSNGMNAALDMAVGSGLGVHIKDAYRFLMQTYNEGDKISLFGFSRGSYTARCLAGMVHKVGLLPAHNRAQVDFAYNYYKDDSEDGWKMSVDFKRTFCMNVNINFIGVFDSVASVGFIPRKLPLSSTPTNRALHFRHAMALDERRAKFKVCRYRQKDGTGSNAEWQVLAEKGDEQAETDVEEVWFLGCHCDVGGGAVLNETRHKLAQIPLRWMIRQCFECDTGIIFKAHMLAEEGIDVHTLWPQYQKLEIPPSGAPDPEILKRYETEGLEPIQRRSSVLDPVDSNDPLGMHHVKLWEDEYRSKLHKDWIPEQMEDYLDGLTEMRDQLKIAKSWWILEFWPIKVRVLDLGTDKFVKKLRFNLGRHRVAQEAAPKIHWTVEHRMQSLGYENKIRTDGQSVWQTVS